MGVRRFSSGGFAENTVLRMPLRFSPFLPPFHFLGPSHGAHLHLSHCIHGPLHCEVECRDIREHTSELRGNRCEPDCLPPEISIAHYANIRFSDCSIVVKLHRYPDMPFRIYILCLSTDTDRQAEPETSVCHPALRGLWGIPGSCRGSFS